VREREDTNRTREAGNRDEVEGVVANTMNLFRNGAVGFIDRLDLMLASTCINPLRNLLRFSQAAALNNRLTTVCDRRDEYRRVVWLLPQPE